MVHCPTCGQSVGRLHPVPPAVLTRSMYEAFGDSPDRSPALCAACIHRLMGGEAPSELLARSGLATR